LLRFNDHGLLGQVIAARAMAHQAECRLSASCSVPSVGHQFAHHNVLGHVYRLLVERGVAFQSPSTTVDTKRFIVPLLPPGVYPKVASRLYLDSIVSLDDVITKDGQSLASWKDL